MNRCFNCSPRVPGVCGRSLQRGVFFQHAVSATLALSAAACCIVAAAQPGTTAGRATAERQLSAEQPHPGTNLQLLRGQILQLPADEVSNADRLRLSGAATQLERAQQSLAAQSNALSPRERGMAQVQIDIAVERLNVAVTEQGGRGGLALSSATRAAEEASAIASRAPGSQRRAITVRVSPARDGTAPAPLEVYAVPLGVVNYVGTLSDAKLHNVLDLGRFAQRTSPAVDQLETGGDYAVWIALPDRLAAVMQLLRQRGLTAYRKVAAHDSTPITLDFTESDQLRLPALPAGGTPVLAPSRASSAAWSPASSATSPTTSPTTSTVEK